MTTLAPLIATPDGAGSRPGAAAEWVLRRPGAREAPGRAVPGHRPRPRAARWWSTPGAPNRSRSISKWWRRFAGAGLRGPRPRLARSRPLASASLADRLPGHADGYADFLSDHDAPADHLRRAVCRGPGSASVIRWAGCLAHPHPGRMGRRVTPARSCPRSDAGPLARRDPAGRRARACGGQSQKLIGRGGVLARRGERGAPETFETNILTHDPVRYARNLPLRSRPARTSRWAGRRGVGSTSPSRPPKSCNTVWARRKHRETRRPSAAAGEEKAGRTTPALGASAMRLLQPEAIVEIPRRLPRDPAGTRRRCRRRSGREFDALAGQAASAPRPCRIVDRFARTARRLPARAT